jgi:hypothetical protein
MSGDIAAVAVNTFNPGDYASRSIHNGIGRLTAVVVDPIASSLYVADTTFNCIRKITLDSHLRIEAMETVPELARFPPGILPLIGTYFPVTGISHPSSLFIQLCIYHHLFWIFIKLTMVNRKLIRSSW